MKTLKTYTKDTLILLTLAQITEINNDFCEVLKSKTTKRFPTKPKAIEKALQNQTLYTKAFKDVTSSEKKPVKKVSNSTIKKFELDTFLELGDIPTKKGTAMGLITFLCSPNSKARADDIITYFMANFKQKRGSAIVDDGFARGYITGALRAGHLKVVK